jgi:hypothetical protein
VVFGLTCPVALAFVEPLLTLVFVSKAYKNNILIQNPNVVSILNEVNSFVFDTEFILLAYKNGLKITPLDINLRPGLKLSAMGMKVMLRELFYFIKVLWRIRIKREYKK